MGFSLQAGAKTLEGKQHPDHDAQFRYINEQARGHVAANTGWVGVGTDHDTAASAVASIRRWWQARGRHTYPVSTRLLITADMHRHRFHGDGNYTLHPHPRDTTSTAPNPRSANCQPSQPGTGYLRNPELARMSEPALDDLVGQLTPELDELRGQGRLQQRGSEHIRARGAGAKDKVTTADRVLATVLYLRKLGTRDLLAQLFAVNGSTFTRAVRQVQPLLVEHGRTIPPRQPGSAHQLTSPRSPHNSPVEIKSAC